MVEKAENTCMYETAHLHGWQGDTFHPGGHALTRHALLQIRLPGNARVLDIGCGNGDSLDILHEEGFRPVGLDQSQILLNSRENTDPPLVCADAGALPFASGTFDAILAECTLSLFHPLEPILSQLSELLSSNGILIISDIYARNPAEMARVKEILPKSCLTGAFENENLFKMLNEHCFESLLWEDHAELIRSMIQPASLPLILGDQAKNTNSLDLLLQLAKAKLSYFLCVARKQSRQQPQRLAGLFKKEPDHWRKEWTILK